jgi:hypothetical protein
LIGEAAADDTGEQRIGAVGVVEAVGGAVRVAEIELRQIPVQMLLRTELLDAAHPPLEDAEVALNRVRVDRAAAILADVVVDDAMLELPLEGELDGAFVGHDLGAAGTVYI